MKWGFKWYFSRLGEVEKWKAHVIVTYRLHLSVSFLACGRSLKLATSRPAALYLTIQYQSHLLDDGANLAMLSPY